MSNSAIIQKVLWKAVRNGWGKEITCKARNLVIEVQDKKVWIGEKNGFGVGMLLSTIIYRPDFSKAYWGKNWLSELQRLMLEPDPVKYLAKNIELTD